jgi:hypothetical protein
MSELVVKFDDKITVGLNDPCVLANVSDYDHYIFVNVEPVDNFTPDIVTKFSFQRAVRFVGPNLRVSNARTSNTINLDFYTLQFKNMFLNMHVNDTESLWLDFISEEKLRSFKQIVLTLKPQDNQVGMNKLNNTHYIVNMKNNGNKITITYLRKDVILEPIFEKEEEEESKLVEEIVAVELDFSEKEEPAVVEEEPAVVEDPVVIDEAVVDEEPVVEEPVAEEEPVVEEPTKKKRTYNKKKKA